MRNFSCITRYWVINEGQICAFWAENWSWLDVCKCKVLWPKNLGRFIVTKPLTVNKSLSANHPLAPVCKCEPLQLENFNWLKGVKGPTTHSLSTSFRGKCGATCPGQICLKQCRGTIDWPYMGCIYIYISRFLKLHYAYIHQLAIKVLWLFLFPFMATCIWI